MLVTTLPPFRVPLDLSVIVTNFPTVPVDAWMLQESCPRDSASSDSPFVSTDREKVLVLLLSLYFLPSLFARGPVCGEFSDQMPGLTMLGCDWSNSLNDLLPLVNPVSIFPLSGPALDDTQWTLHWHLSPLTHSALRPAGLGDSPVYLISSGSVYVEGQWTNNWHLILCGGRRITCQI